MAENPETNVWRLLQEANESHARDVIRIDELTQQIDEIRTALEQAPSSDSLAKLQQEVIALEKQRSNLQQQLTGRFVQNGQEVCSPLNENCRRVSNEKQKRIDELVEELKQKGAVRSTAKISRTSERTDPEIPMTSSIGTDVSALLSGLAGEPSIVTLSVSAGSSPAAVRSAIEEAGGDVIKITPKPTPGFPKPLPYVFPGAAGAAGSASATALPGITVSAEYFISQRAGSATPYLVAYINGLSQTAQISIKPSLPTTIETFTPSGGITVTGPSAPADDTVLLVPSADYNDTVSQWKATNLLNPQSVKVRIYFATQLINALNVNDDTERCKRIAAIVKDSLAFKADNELVVPEDRTNGIPVLREEVHNYLISMLNILGIPIQVARPHFGDDSTLFLAQIRAMDQYYPAANLLQFLYGSLVQPSYSIPILVSAFRDVLATTQLADVKSLPDLAYLYTRIAAKVAAIISDRYRSNPRLGGVKRDTRGAVIVQIAKSIFAGANNFNASDPAKVEKMIQAIFAGDENFNMLIRFANAEYENMNTTNVDRFIVEYGLEIEVYGPVIKPSCEVGIKYCPVVNVQLPRRLPINPVNDSVEVIYRSS